MQDDFESPLAAAWAMIKAIPAYYHDPEEGPEHLILMNDVWAWATSCSIDVTDDNAIRIAQLYNEYGFCGLLYYQGVELDRLGAPNAPETRYAEFEDIQRFVEFVVAEERIKKEVPDYNKRAYAKRQYVIGTPKPKRKKIFGIF